MRRRTMAAIAGAALALVAVTTALATPGDGPLALLGGGGDRDERRAEHARALGEKLGVDPGRVERALGEIHSDRREVRQDALARALAERLDVPVGDAERAVERAFAVTRPERGLPRPERGERGERGEKGGPLARAIANELDKRPQEVREALRAFRRERLEQRLAEAVREGRVTERQADELRERIESRRGRGLGPRGGPGFGPPHGGHGPGFGPPPEEGRL